METREMCGISPLMETCQIQVTDMSPLTAIFRTFHMPPLTAIFRTFHLPPLTAIFRTFHVSPLTAVFRTFDGTIHAITCEVQVSLIKCAEYRC